MELSCCFPYGRCLEGSQLFPGTLVLTSHSHTMTRSSSSDITGGHFLFDSSYPSFACILPKPQTVSLSTTFFLSTAFITSFRNRNGKQPIRGAFCTKTALRATPTFVKRPFEIVQLTAGFHAKH